MFTPPPIVSLVRVTLVGLNCVGGIQSVAWAQDNQSPPWLFGREATPLVRKTEAPATAAVSNSNAWMAAAPYPIGIYNCGFAQNGDDFYIISGIRRKTYSPPVTGVRRYNVSSNTWTLLANIPRGSVSPPAIYYEGKIYVGDGYDYTSVSNTLRIYDVASNTWSAGPPSPVSHNSGSAAAAFNGNIYFIGVVSTSIYNIANNSWSSGPPPPAWEIGSTPGYAQIGQYLYVVGGVTGGCGLPGCANSDSSIRLDMTSNTWSVGPRSDLSPGQLCSGRCGQYAGCNWR